MTKRQVIVNTLAFFIVAACFGCIEGSGHVHWGPPNLFGLLIAEWHIPMFVIMLVTGYLTSCLVHALAWVLVEDLTYWVASHFLWGNPDLAAESWVSFSLGGFDLFGVYLPWTYVLLFIAWLIVLWIAHRRGK